LERLSDLPSTLVQLGEREWTIYVSLDAPEIPELIYGRGVSPTRVSFLSDQDRPLTRDTDPSPLEHSPKR
jgi:hypothetical protein